MKSGIYAIWNSITDKIYVGQAVNISKRWKNHKVGLKINAHSNRYLQSAYNKDRLFLVFYVLEFCEPIQEILDEREQYYMDLYDSSNREKGYNLCPKAGGSPLGFKHSDETKALLSAKRKNKPRTEEARAAIKAGWEKRKAKGPVSEETKRKQSESHKGKSQSDEFKLAASKRMIGNNYNTGRKQSLEEIEARKISNIGKKRSLESRNRMSVAQKGKPKSEEAKIKMSLAAKARHERNARLRFKALMFRD